MQPRSALVGTIQAPYVTAGQALHPHPTMALTLVVLGFPVTGRSCVVLQVVSWRGLEVHFPSVWHTSSFVSLLVEVLCEALDLCFFHILVLCFVDMRESFLGSHTDTFPSHAM